MPERMQLAFAYSSIHPDGRWYMPAACDMR